MKELGRWALTALVTWFLVSRVGLSLEDLRASSFDVRDLNPWRLGGASVLLLGGYAMSAVVWARIVLDLGGPPLPVRRAAGIYLVANLGRYVPGKIWQIAGLATLSRKEGVPIATATAAAVLGQGIALLAAGSLGLLALFGAPEPYPIWGGAGLALLTLGLGAAMFPRLYGAAVEVWFRLARSTPPKPPTPRQGFAWYGLYLCNWIVYALAFWGLAGSLGLHGSPLDVGSAFAAAYVLGYAVVVAPAGLGPREGFLIAFLTPQFGAGAAGIVAVAARIWTTLIEVLPAAYFWMSARRWAHER